MKADQAIAMSGDPVELEKAEPIGVGKLLEQTERNEGFPRRIRGVVVGCLIGVTEFGVPVVDWAENPLNRVLIARSAARVAKEQIGLRVALLFENCDPSLPILIGFIEEPKTSTMMSPDKILAAQVDSQRIVLSAEREIVLQCGEASITLTQTGKIRIRGTSLLSRASGPNRIKGGSVQIN